LKVSDYIAKFLAVNGVQHVFGVQGGAVVHLFDSIERHELTRAIYCHHEQAAALAATSNAKVTGSLGVAIVTTGPAATNAMTGLLAAWQDSTPVLFISGQTRIEHTSYGKPVRQVGSQECAILDLVRPITKYSALLTRVEDLPGHLENAFNAAFSGRFGPVWLDIPVNLQWEQYDFVMPSATPLPEPLLDDGLITQPQLDQLLNMTQHSTKPLIVAGNGIRASRSSETFLNFIKTKNIPYVTTWSASDIGGSDESLNLGIIGVNGQRGANKALYAADLILCLGTHLSITQTGTLFKEFAPQARKIIVDIDKGELANLNIEFDLKINMDLTRFFCNKILSLIRYKSSAEWQKSAGRYRALNSVIDTLAAHSGLGTNSAVNSNYFNYQLTKLIPSTSQIVVDGGGTALYTGHQSSHRQRGQRLICSGAISAMGTGLPESVGVSIGLHGCEVYCLIGDGSLMFNLQELQTIIHHNLPIKIIVYNNFGYLAIKHTQTSFLENRYFGTDSSHGISMPEIENIAACFAIPYLKVGSLEETDSLLPKIISSVGPLLVEVIVPQDQATLFQQAFREIESNKFRPVNLSEMAPYFTE
jgi:acetolactate synthase-1/2/3 large subunit